MGIQKSKEPVKKEAYDILDCLTKNNFNSQRCLNVIELLQSCCEKCNYNSTHCAYLSGLLKSKSKLCVTEGYINEHLSAHKDIFMKQVGSKNVEARRFLWTKHH